MNAWDVGLFGQIQQLLCALKAYNDGVALIVAGHDDGDVLCTAAVDFVEDDIVKLIIYRNMCSDIYVGFVNA